MAGSSRPDLVGSFREGSQLSAAGTPRALTEPPSLAQYLSLEPFPVGDHKQSRTAELRRVLGVTVEAEQSFGLVQTKPLPSIASEELKRIRGGVVESSTRAKERAKSLQESIQKLDKYRNVVTRRRQRSEGAAERSSGGGSGSLRMGAQNNGENPGQRLEERAKSATTSKRARSSLTADARLEVRGNVPTRQGPLGDTEKNSPLEKEKSSVRNVNVTSGFSEDKLRGLSPGSEGWEKKLKRKRSVGTMLNRGNDVDRDAKPLVQHRSNNEVRARSSDGLPFRHGASAGAVGGSKMDGGSQQSNRFSEDKLRGLSPGSEGWEKKLKRKRSVGTMLSRGNDVDRDAKPLVQHRSNNEVRARSSDGLQFRHGASAGALGGSKMDGGSQQIHPRSPPTVPSPDSVGQRPQKMSRTRRANVVSPATFPPTSSPPTVPSPGSVAAPASP